MKSMQDISAVEFEQLAMRVAHDLEPERAWIKFDPADRANYRKKAWYLLLEQSEQNRIGCFEGKSQFDPETLTYKANDGK